jgi:hypothetical protein
VISVCDYFHVDFVIGIFFDKFLLCKTDSFLKALFSKAHNISVASIFESSTVINCPFYDELSSFDFQRCRYNGVTLEAIASNSDADTPSVIGILM